MLISDDSLIGKAIYDADGDYLGGATDDDGFTDYEELDYRESRCYWDREELERDAEILAIYAEEVLRFA